MENERAAAEYLILTLNALHSEVILELLCSGPINWMLADKWSMIGTFLEHIQKEFSSPDMRLHHDGKQNALN